MIDLVHQQGCRITVPNSHLAGVNIAEKQHSATKLRKHAIQAHFLISFRTIVEHTK